MRYLAKYGVMFVVLVLAQVLLFNQVHFRGFLTPFIYILFIMLLPVSTPRYLLLIFGVLTGLSVDVFSNSLGMHAAATTFLAFIRPWVIRAISNRDEDRLEYPGLKQNTFTWFLYYTIFMVFSHHLVLFYLEFFTFTNFLVTLFRVFLSSLFSVIIIILSQFLIFRD